MNIETLPSAQKDLHHGYNFYERQAIGVGTFFVKTLSLEIEKLRLTAGIHSKRGKLFRVKSKKFPHWIYYRIADSLVYVVAVLDARRSPIAIRKREKKEQLFDDYCLDEPPAWHEAIIEERIEEWEQRKTVSRDVEEVFRDLKTELGINR